MQYKGIPTMESTCIYCNFRTGTCHCIIKKQNLKRYIIAVVQIYHSTLTSSIPVIGFIIYVCYQNDWIILLPAADNLAARRYEKIPTR